MCRLLGYVSHPTMAVRDVMPGTDFDQFVELSRLHGDGWGMAWCEGATVRQARAPTAALHDPDFARLACMPLTDLGLVHLRWATDGLAVQSANTHPFVADGIAMAHNGSIAPIDELTGLLSPASRAALTGTTDSERYFRLVLQSVTAAGDTVTGLRSAVELLARRFPRASLNAMLIDKDRLVAVHASSSAPPPVDDMLARYRDPDRAPVDHRDRYFRLRYRVGNNAVVIASTGLTGTDWRPVPENSLLVVDRRDAAIDQVPLRTCMQEPAR